MYVHMYIRIYVCSFHDCYNNQYSILLHYYAFKMHINLLMNSSYVYAYAHKRSILESHKSIVYY